MWTVTKKLGRAAPRCKEEECTSSILSPYSTSSSSISLPLSRPSSPFVLLMELAVDQIKKRSLDYHAFLPEVMNILVIGKRNIQEFAAKFGLITCPEARAATAKTRKIFITCEFSTLWLWICGLVDCWIGGVEACRLEFGGFASQV